MPTLHVVAGAIHRDGRVLVAQRPAGKAQAGLWEFPGGKIEPRDASPQEALRRELYEELGVTVEVGDHIATCEHTYDHGTITLSLYLCETHEAPRPLEHLSLRWITASARLDWAPADLPLLAPLWSAISRQL